jgi:hypothetical protein
MKPRIELPRLLDKLLNWLIAPHLREEVLGDLHERYALRAKRLGDNKARQRCWRDALTYLHLSNIKRKPAEYPTIHSYSPTMLRNYFKIALRKSIKDLRFTVLNLVGLSTALACTFMIYLWVNDELTIDKFNKNDKHLYRVLYNINFENDIITLEQTPSPLAAALKAEMPEVEKAVSVNFFENGFAGKGIASNGKKNAKVQGIFASKDYFTVFSTKLIEGNKEVVLSTKNGVVISEKLAKTLFNTTKNLIGKPLDWDHRMKPDIPLSISGVFENPPANATHQFDIIFNYELLAKDDKYVKDWTGTYAHTYLLLKNGTDIARFNEKIKYFSKKKNPANGMCTLFVAPFSDKYL